MKLISVLTPCYNEEENVRELVDQVRTVFRGLPQYRYEHIFIDNASEDQTVARLKEIAAADQNVKIIVNTRNFGHVRSPHYGLLQSRGDAVVVLVADLQDPPDLIPGFLGKWEAGCKVVLGVRDSSDEGRAMAAARRLYYALLAKLSDSPIIRNVTGFGLYDRSFVDLLRQLDDPYPYGRGLVSEFGLPTAFVTYRQARRRHGRTKNNFLTLYDLAMTGITSHSKWPLRVATLGGFVLSALSLLVALGYLVAKLLFWYRYPAGVAPILIGLFVAFSVQLFFLGLLGEYVAVIHTRVMRRPLVVERERVNFD
jgi:glycosyltransferase involved in cell wall biosynthesis